MITTLKPGLLVSLHTRLSGGVSYRTRTIEGEHSIGETATRAKWETTKTTADADEHKAAVLARASARNTVTAQCRYTDFGLLCPAEDEPALLEALEAARVIAAGFNAEARYSRIDVYAVIGRVAADDVEATRAITAELAACCQRMEDAISKAEPEKIRDAADKARALGAMLDEAASKRLDEAIEQARANAREIVRRVSKAGESAALVVESLNMDKLQSARMAFLDLEEQAREASEIAAASLVGRNVDNSVADESEPAAPAFVAPTVEADV